MTYLVKNNRSLFIIPFLLINLIYSQTNSNQIFGFITDSKSGEALIGANVFIQENGKGMATDINGYYVISGIEMAEATLVASYVGYKRFEKKINFENDNPNKSINLNISMEVQALEILQIDVTAEEIERLNKIEPSRINLSPRMLKAQPALAEPDIFRTIQSLDGRIFLIHFPIAFLFGASIFQEGQIYGNRLKQSNMEYFTNWDRSHVLNILGSYQANKKHDKNGNKRPDIGETNVDEPDEGRIQRQDINLFPIIPTIGITFEF